MIEKQIAKNRKAGLMIGIMALIILDGVCVYAMENNSSVNLQLIASTHNWVRTGKYMRFDTHLYELKNMNDYGIDSWDSLLNYCESEGGYLSVISSPEENAVIYELVSSQGYTSAFFGYTDQYSEGNWVWEGNCEDSFYTNWAQGQPNNKINNSYPEGEHYAQFYKENTDGTWNDAPFKGNTTMFVMEIDDTPADYYQSENTVDWYEIVSEYSEGIAVHPEPDKDSATLIRIPYGEVFPVYYYAAGTDYGFTSYNGLDGYINLSYAQFLYTDAEYEDDTKYSTDDSTVSEADLELENYLSDGYYQYHELANTLMNEFPGEYEYPDENNEILRDAILALYSMELENNPYPDMIWKGLSDPSHGDHFFVDFDQFDKLLSVDEVLTIKGLSDKSCLSFFKYTVYCINCEDYISGIGSVYFQIGDGIIEFSYGDDVPLIKDYMERKKSDDSWICDQVHDWRLIDTMMQNYGTSETKF